MHTTEEILGEQEWGRCKQCTRDNPKEGSAMSSTRKKQVKQCNGQLPSTTIVTTYECRERGSTLRQGVGSSSPPSVAI